MTSYQMDATDGNLTLTVPQAHAVIGKENVSRGCFYAAIGRGEVPSVRLGKRILIPRRPFMKWLAAPAGVSSANGKAELEAVR
jgi:excisionase family DNA binding protein